MDKFRQIAEELSEEAVLEQVIEECAEVIQAGAKRLRILRGENPTPVSLIENADALTEELADVAICMNVLSWKMDIDKGHFILIKDRKVDRWIQRLQAKKEAMQ